MAIPANVVESSAVPRVIKSKSVGHGSHVHRVRVPLGHCAHTRVGTTLVLDFESPKVSEMTHVTIAARGLLPLGQHQRANQITEGSLNQTHHTNVFVCPNGKESRIAGSKADALITTRLQGRLVQEK